MSEQSKKEHRRQYMKLYMRQYRLKNRDKEQAWRKESAINFLIRQGYIVIPSSDNGGDIT